MTKTENRCNVDELVAVLVRKSSVMREDGGPGRRCGGFDEQRNHIH